MHRACSTTPIVMSERDAIEEFDALAVEFFRDVLGMDYRACFVSDESELRNFALAASQWRRGQCGFAAQGIPWQFSFLSADGGERLGLFQIGGRHGEAVEQSLVAPGLRLGLR